jgi:hypothetical protein
MKKLTIAMMLVLVGYGLSANASVITLTRVFAGDMSAGPESYNMTEMGQTDWKFWGNSLTVPANEKNGGSGIGDLSYTPGTLGGTFEGGSSGKSPQYTFTDGTDPVSATASTIQTILKSPTVNSINDTISFSVAASTEQSTLYIIACAIESTLELSASLAGAANQTDSWVQNATQPYLALYKLDYTADSDSDLITVSLKKTAYDKVDRNYIGIQSAALSVVPEPATLSLIAIFGVALLLRRRFKS